MCKVESYASSRAKTKRARNLYVMRKGTILAKFLGLISTPSCIMGDVASFSDFNIATYRQYRSN